MGFRSHKQLFRHIDEVIQISARLWWCKQLVTTLIKDLACIASQRMHICCSHPEGVWDLDAPISQDRLSRSCPCHGNQNTIREHLHTQEPNNSLTLHRSVNIPHTKPYKTEHKKMLGDNADSCFTIFTGTRSYSLSDVVCCMMFTETRLRCWNARVSHFGPFRVQRQSDEFPWHIVLPLKEWNVE